MTRHFWSSQGRAAACMLSLLLGSLPVSVPVFAPVLVPISASVLLLPPQVHAQEPAPVHAHSASLHATPAAVDAMARAFGFVIGQGVALDMLAEAHPALADEAAGAREAFDAAFPEVEDKLAAELRSAFGAAVFTKFRGDLLERVTAARAKEPISADEAEDFLALVLRRAQGEGVEQDILDYLLAASFAADPAAEFADGFRQRFRADGSGKAQGLKLRLQLPRSWTGGDVDRPTAVQRWVSEGGHGNAAIQLDVRDARGFNPSKNEIARFIAQGGVRELVIDGAEVVDASAYSLETLPGFSALLQSTLPDRPGALSWTQMYQVFFRGKAISLTCTATGKSDDTPSVEQHLRRIQPLCRQVASSLVIEQLYD